MLTVAEAAQRLRVSRATVYKLVAEGQLPHVRIGNQIRFLSEAFAGGQGPGWRGKGRSG